MSRSDPYAGIDSSADLTDDFGTIPEPTTAEVLKALRHCAERAHDVAEARMFVEMLGGKP